MPYYPHPSQITGGNKPGMMQQFQSGMSLGATIREGRKRKRITQLAKSSIDPATGEFSEELMIRNITREFPQEGLKMKHAMAQRQRQVGGSSRMVRTIDPGSGKTVWARREEGKLTPMMYGDKPAEAGFAPVLKKAGDQFINKEGDVVYKIPKTRSEKIKDEDNRRKWAQHQLKKETLDLKKEPGWTQIDKLFATDYNDLVSKGGLADAIKGVDQIQEVKGELTSGKNLTGALISMLPDSVRMRTNPESMNVQELLEEVVQRNLRVILGAQFTENEGRRLIARAYNPALKEEINAKRVGRLMESMQTALEAKLEAIQYFEKNQTLRGFQSKTLDRAIRKLDGLRFEVDGKKTAPKTQTKTLSDDEILNEVFK